jgi:hypothetical protein
MIRTEGRHHITAVPNVVLRHSSRRTLTTAGEGFDVNQSARPIRAFHCLCRGGSEILRVYKKGPPEQREAAKLFT